MVYNLKSWIWYQIEALAMTFKEDHVQFLILKIVHIMSDFQGMCTLWYGSNRWLSSCIQLDIAT
jgi:hypothetical protein